MFIKKLQIENFRNIVAAEIDPHPALNLFSGSNGAGKTSILESIVVLSRGRSFRTTQAGELIGAERNTFSVFAEISGKKGSARRLGLERSGKRWRARKDGEDLSQLSQLTRSLPLTLMEPNSHLLVSGAPEVRRRYLDWGTFHVKQEFLGVWRRYSKILKQRNAALRNRQAGLLDSIDQVLSPEGKMLSDLRKQHFGQIKKRLKMMLLDLNSGLDDIEITFDQGWGGESLKEALEEGRERDLDRGLTLSGPHRAEISFRWRGAPAKATLSRGEQKTLAAGLLLSQAQTVSELGEDPIILMDDLASEFDTDHFKRVLLAAMNSGGQVWVTGTGQQEVAAEYKMFHVEHGRVQEML